MSADSGIRLRCGHRIRSLVYRPAHDNAVNERGDGVCIPALCPDPRGEDLFVADKTAQDLHPVRRVAGAMIPSAPAMIASEAICSATPPEKNSFPPGWLISATTKHSPLCAWAEATQAFTESMPVKPWQMIPRSRLKRPDRR